MQMNRRDFLAGAGLALASTQAGLSQMVPGPGAAPGFRTSLPNCPVLLGCAFIFDYITRNPGLQAAINRDLRMINPEGVMSWAGMRPDPQNFYFSGIDKYLKYATDNGLKMSGALSWNDHETPKWFATSLNRDNARAILADHITKLVSRYQGKLQYWDVVNEAIQPADKRPDLLSAHPWTDLIGPEYIDLAFHTAAANDPSTPLIMNETDMERDDAQGVANRSALFTLLKGLKSRGVPMNGLGLQGHLALDRPSGGPDFQNFLKAVVGLGLDIYITELDVNDTKMPGTNQQRDQAVADKYARYLETVFSIVEPKVIVFWSYENGDNWLDRMVTSNPNARRADGTAHRPGIVDQGAQATPAHAAIDTVLHRYCR